MIVNTSVPLAGAFADSDSPIDWYTPPSTTEDRLQRIRVLGQRIRDHVRFMTEVDKLAGASAEAKGKAVAIFYERLVSMEQQLGRIQNDLQLA